MSMQLFWVIVLMTAATYPFRFLPALLLKQIRIPAAVDYAMQMMPFCIMVSMVTVAVVAVVAAETMMLQKIAALIAVLAVSYVTANVGLGVVTGVVIYSVLF